MLEDKKCLECRWIQRVGTDKAYNYVCLNECSDYAAEYIEDIPDEGCDAIYPMDDKEVYPVRCNKTPMLDGLKL